MANDLTTTDQAAAPAELRHPSRDLANMVAAFTNTIVDDGPGRALSMPILPTPMQRRVLEDRLAVVTALLRGHDYSTTGSSRAQAALEALFGSKIEHRGTGEDVAGWLNLMRDRPAWAIEEACRDWFDGNVWDVDGKGRRTKVSPDFLPTAARINQIAIEKCADLAAEQAKLKRVLGVKERTIGGRTVAIPAPKKLFVEKRPDGSVLTNDANYAAAAQRTAAESAMKERMLAFNEKLMLDEYAHLGIEPIRDAGGRVVSAGVARSMGVLGKAAKQRKQKREQNDVPA